MCLIALNVAGQALTTLDRLEAVERERDVWQRAPDIIAPLQLHDGSRVVDLGCGAGYFALRLAPYAGPHGSVIAVDILRMPLAFLWIRARRRGLSNVHVILGEPDDPHVAGPVDAVLIANTWHEIRRRRVVLDRLRHTLAPRGRLVIADRQPGQNDHAIDAGVVETELRDAGFEIIVQTPHLLDQPGEGPWWMIVAQKASL